MKKSNVIVGTAIVVGVLSCLLMHLIHGYSYGIFLPLCGIGGIYVKRTMEQEISWLECSLLVFVMAIFAFGACVLLRFFFIVF